MDERQERVARHPSLGTLLSEIQNALFVTPTDAPPRAKEALRQLVKMRNGEITMTEDQEACALDVLEAVSARVGASPEATLEQFEKESTDPRMYVTNPDGSTRDDVFACLSPVERCEAVRITRLRLRRMGVSADLTESDNPTILGIWEIARDQAILVTKAKKR